MKNDSGKSSVVTRRHIGRLFVLLSVLIFSFATADSPSLEYYGRLTQGGILIGKSVQAAEVFLNGQQVELTEQGEFVIGFGRDAELKQTLELVDAEGKRRSETLTLEKRVYNIQRVEGVPQKTVTPPESALARIQEETAQVKAARTQFHVRHDFLDKFVAPASGRITGVYGSQRFYNGQPKRPHFGVDYAGPVGTPVKAPANGIVTLVHPDMYYSGGTLIIDHGFSLSSTFIHLSEVLVEEGQEVKQGDIIAKIGQGGRSTGPHLDWRMNWKSERVDPQLMLEVQLPDNF